MQYSSQAVAKPYFVAAIGLFVGQNAPADVLADAFRSL